MVPRRARGRVFGLVACGVLFACGAPQGGSPGTSPAAAGTPVAVVAPVAVDPPSPARATGDAGAGVTAATRGRVVDVGAGWQHACALLDDSTVRCWGRGDQGQIGDGMGELRRRPTPVIAVEGVMRGAAAARGSASTPLAPLRGAVSLGVGQDHACAALHDGTVRCWGKSSSGELGVMRVSGWSPHTVPGVTGAVENTSGHYYNCARIKDGTVRCWGGVPTGITR